MGTVYRRQERSCIILIYGVLKMFDSSAEIIPLDFLTRNLPG